MISHIHLLKLSLNKKIFCEGLKMSNSKLISYITDFQTKSDMKVGEVEWEKIMNKNFDKFKELEQSDKQLLKYGIKRVH